MEIHGAILSMNDDGATGSDGFADIFYVECWDIIKNDLIKAIQFFFQGNPLPKLWTSTLVVTIPKIDYPKSFNDMRPIRLCNFSAKIVSKIMADRLSHVFLP